MGSVAGPTATAIWDASCGMLSLFGLFGASAFFGVFCFLHAESSARETFLALTHRLSGQLGEIGAWQSKQIPSTSHVSPVKPGSLRGQAAALRVFDRERSKKERRRERARGEAQGQHEALAESSLSMPCAALCFSTVPICDLRSAICACHQPLTARRVRLAGTATSHDSPHYHTPPSGRSLWRALTYVANRDAVPALPRCLDGQVAEQGRDLSSICVDRGRRSKGCPRLCTAHLLHRATDIPSQSGTYANEYLAYLTHIQRPLFTTHPNLANIFPFNHPSPAALGSQLACPRILQKSGNTFALLPHQP